MVYVFFEGESKEPPLKTPAKCSPFFKVMVASWPCARVSWSRSRDREGASDEEREEAYRHVGEEE